MEKKSVVNLLNDLMQLDIDAWHAYGEAIEKLDTALDIRDTLERFRGDHHRHVTEISARLRDLGEEPPGFSPDFKGYIIQGFTSLRSITGTKGALAAMETNEKLTNRKYADALENEGIPSDIHALIEANYKDEQEHLRYIRDRYDYFFREGGSGRSQYY